MSLYLADAAATLAFGRQLASRLPPASTLLLHGDLGAGKTCLVQGLAAGLGIDEPITSPTFALAQHYRLAGIRGPAGGGLVHLDLYRLDLPAAARSAPCWRWSGPSDSAAYLPVAGRCTSTWPTPTTPMQGAGSS